MKLNSSILTLLVAALSAGTSWGQLPISPTSGIQRISLTTGVTNVVAVPFAKSIPFEGTISGVSGTTLTLSGVTLTPGALTNHAIYIPTHVNPSVGGGAYGRVVEIVSNTATQVVTASAITPFAGDEFQIIEQFTLSSLLGDVSNSNYQLYAGTNRNNSDIVYVEQGGVFSGYWHDTGATVGWKPLSDATGSGPNATNVKIPFGKGLLINSRQGTSFTVTGEPITGRFVPPTLVGSTVCINNPYQVAVPLIESGIANFIETGTSRNNADIVYLESTTTPGVILGYWRRTSNGNWYPITDGGGTGTPLSNSVVINPGKAILFLDRNNAGFGMPQPFAE